MCTVHCKSTTSGNYRTRVQSKRGSAGKGNI